MTMVAIGYQDPIEVPDEALSPRALAHLRKGWKIGLGTAALAGCASNYGAIGYGAIVPPQRGGRGLPHPIDLRNPSVEEVIAELERLAE